jgi:hypothetical protein
MDHVDLGQELEIFAGEVRRGAPTPDEANDICPGLALA